MASVEAEPPAESPRLPCGRRPRVSRRRPRRSLERRSSEERVLRKIFTRKAASDQDYFEEVERYTRECHGHWEEKPDPVGGYAIADPSAWSGNGVIEDFLDRLDDGRPAREVQVRAPSPRLYGARSAERLAEQVEELRVKLNGALRENRRLKEVIAEKDQRLRRLLDDFERIRKDPHAMHPTISRLRKLGLNTPALADLSDRWAGYVFGRTSMAMEVGSYSFRNVFATHCANGVLAEESFKAVIRQFEPQIKGDQLTRLWFFADEDGSGRIDLFEFMRMVGCNSNGEMGDEYYEVLAMHLYRKFHAKGGVRRVYATADKNWDQRLDLQEFTRMIKTHLKDVEFTKGETNEVFKRINSSGTGQMTLQELEMALEAAGAKCYVSEAWVKETLQQFTVAVQEAGLNIKQLWAGGSVTEKEFRDTVLRFLTQLRPSQLDRLWKFLCTACTEDAVPGRHVEKDRLPADAVVGVVFGPTLTSSVNDVAPNAGGVGREALEQLVQQLVRRVGDASPDLCFDAMNPFITAEHFKQLLTTRLGLHYDPVKAKQIFKLIDSDRDGKITRLEFGLMFKTVTPSGARDCEPEDDKENERQLQMSRMHNRVLLLQQELELCRGAARNMEPSVPEKQFQQLTTAHAKVASQMQVLKEKGKAATRGQDSKEPMPVVHRNSLTASHDLSFAAFRRKSSCEELEAETWTPGMELTEAEEFQWQLQALKEANDYLRKRLKRSEAAESSGSSDEGRELARSEEQAIQALPTPKLEELFGPVHLLLARLQKALVANPNFSKRQVQEMLLRAGEVILEGRWKLENVLSYSARMVVARCSDAFLRRNVVVKVAQSLEASQQLARSVYVLRELQEVSLAPKVHYFSSPASSLPYLVMDLLEGSTLQSRFQAIAEGQVEEMADLEAAELGYSLLTGVDACHQRQVFNLNLCPEHVWVNPKLEGSRVMVLDWSNAEIGAASVVNTQAYAVGDMRRRGLLRGKGRPLFLAGGLEVQPSELWSSARKRSGAAKAGALSSMAKLSLFGHGSLYYMSMEQLYCAVRSFQKEVAPSRAQQRWHEESVGSVVKVEGHTAHWFQKGDGFIQTHLPIVQTPLGQLFEVEVVRAVNAGKRGESELGLCIGLTSRPPQGRSEESKSRQKQECWIAGGDCAYYLRGAQHRVGKEDETSEKYLRVSSDLKPKDRVAILAEWSGNLSLFLNGQQCGRFVEAIDPIEVMAPLYGVADMYVRQASEEYTVRSISLVDTQGEHLPLYQQAATELYGIHEHLDGEASISTTMGPSCDLYACGRILLSCFRGGFDIMPSLNLDRFAVAYAEWVRAGCPVAEKRYSLLWALKELKTEKTERSEELLQVEKMEVRLLLSRCVKRSRYSRLGSCWEAAEMLAQASCWLGMSEEFLCSHKLAVEQAKRASLLDAHYSVAQELLDKERRPSKDPQTRAELAVQAAESTALGAISARWNLRPFTIGPPQIRRIIQVLREWKEGELIQAVGLARFEADISPELQDVFLQCFSDVLRPQHGKAMRPRKRGKELRHSLGNINLDQLKKPVLFLEDTQLPTEELQRSVFPLEEILERNLLWLVSLQVAKLDLTPSPGALGQERAPSIGSVPGALDILVSAMQRSSLLTSLSLRSSHLRDNQGQTLSGGVSKCTLRELDLSDNHLGPKAVAKVVQAGRDNLQELDLSRNHLGDEGARALAQALGKGPSSGYSLTVLRLRCNGIGDEGAEALAEAFMSLVTLHELDLGENQLNVTTAAVILRAVSSAKVIRRLHLDGNLAWPSSESYQVEVASFTDQLGGVPLEMLNLRHCKMHSTGGKKLFESLASNQSLVKLNVACTGLRQGAALALAHALALPSALEELDLRDNRLGLQDALSLAMHQVFLAGDGSGPWNGSLRSLNLGNNEICGEELGRLVGALARFTALEELRLYHNPLLGDAGAQALAQLLRAETQLLHLNLAACSIGDVGCAALMAALVDYKALRVLELSCNGIGDDACPAIAPLLSQRCGELQELGLSMNSLSSFGIWQLMEAVAQNVDGGLKKVDVATQDVGNAKTSFIEEPSSPKSGAKVRSKFVGLR